MLTIMVTHVRAAYNERVIFWLQAITALKLTGLQKRTGYYPRRGGMRRRWGHTYIGSEHILLSIMEEGASTACAVLIKHSVTVEAVEKQMLRMIGRGTPCRLTQNDFTPTALTILKGACNLSESFGAKQTGSEYILALILRQSNACAAEILRELDCNLTRMYADCTSAGNDRTVFMEQNYVKLKNLERYGRELTRKAACEQFDRS